MTATLRRDGTAGPAEVRRTSTSGGLAARAAQARARADGAPAPSRRPRPQAGRAERAHTPSRRPRPEAGGSAGMGALAAAARPEARPARPVPRHHEAPRPRLRVVDRSALDARTRRRAARALLVGAGLLAVAVVFGLVYLHVVSAQKQFVLDRLNTTAATAQSRYEGLRLQVDSESSPEHVMAVATQLGMREPASVTFLQPPARPGSAPAARTPEAAVPSATPAAAPAGISDWTSIKGVLEVGP